jgi:outer membrane protein assembly factor BamB
MMSPRSRPPRAPPAGTLAIAAMLACTPLQAGADARAAVNGTAGPTVLCVSGDHILSGGDGLRSHDPRTLESRPLGLPGVATHEPTCLDDGRVLLGSRSGVHAVDATTGALLWRRPQLGDSFSPVVRGDTAWVGTRGGELTALALADGEPRWTRRSKGWRFTPAVTGTAVIAGGQAHRLAAFDADTGAARWDVALPQELVHGPLATRDGAAVLVTTWAPSVQMHAVEDGRLLWRAEPDAAAHVALGDHGEVYAGTLGGRVQALAADGRPLWQTTLDVRMETSPGIDAAGARLAVALRPHRDRGAVAILDARDGTVLCRRPLDGPAAGAPRFTGQGLLIAIATAPHRRAVQRLVALHDCGSPTRSSDDPTSLP